MDLFSILTGPVRRMSHVHRYSSFPVHRKENVAEHSWWVAFIAMLIARDLKKSGLMIDIDVVLERAMVHDLDECISGDIIRSFKYRTPGMRREIGYAAEDNMREITAKMAPVGVTVYEAWRRAKEDSLEGDIVGFADMVSVVVYCREERLLGNREVEPLLKEMYEKWFCKYHEHHWLGQYADQLFPTRRFHDAFVAPKLAPLPIPMMHSHSEGPTAEHDWAGGEEVPLG